MSMSMAKREKRLVFDESTEIVVEQENDPVKKMRIGEEKHREKGIPNDCDCGVLVTLETSKSPKNRGEKTFRCGYDIYGGGEGCGFMKSWEDALFEEFEKIQEEKEELQQRLDGANKRIDKLEGMIYQIQMQYEEMMAHRKCIEDYGGELCGTQLGLAEMRDKNSDLERRFELLEMKYQNQNKHP